MLRVSQSIFLAVFMSVVIARAFSQQPVSDAVEHRVAALLQQMTLDEKVGQLVQYTSNSQETLALVGPSGCGKTTLLKLIGGYLTPQTGRIVLRDRDVTRLLPEARNIGMVFQNYALFPHLSARENVAFGLELRRVAKAERERRVRHMLERVGLKADEQERKPAKLSGGQQQRVALARALVIEPDVLLLDEPLAAMGVREGRVILDLVQKIRSERKVTIVIIAHNHAQILDVCDWVCVVQHGTISFNKRSSETSVQELMEVICAGYRR